jgi:hypothetical protein
MFQALLDDDLRALESLKAGGGGGKEYATVVVAASNSHATGKATADFVCTGTNDETVIQQAVNAVAAVGGGRVVLLEGTYTFSTTAGTKVSITAPTVIEGQSGLGSTINLVGNASGPAVAFDLSAPLVLRQLNVSSANTNWTILRSHTNAAITLDQAMLSGTSTSIFDIQPPDITTPFVMSACNVNMGVNNCTMGTLGTKRVVVTDCRFLNVGLVMKGTVARCLFGNSGVITTQLFVQSNDSIGTDDDPLHVVQCQFSPASLTTHKSVVLRGRGSIIGSHFVGGGGLGVQVERSRGVVVVANLFRGTFINAIKLLCDATVGSPVHSTRIENNLFNSTFASANTSDEILLAVSGAGSAVWRNTAIYHNVFAPSGNSARYWINVSDARFENTTIIGNVFGSVGTAAVNNVGTNTQLTLPSATIGANFQFP